MLGLGQALLPCSARISWPALCMQKVRWVAVVMLGCCCHIVAKGEAAWCWSQRHTQSAETGAVPGPRKREAKLYSGAGSTPTHIFAVCRSGCSVGCTGGGASAAAGGPTAPGGPGRTGYLVPCSMQASSALGNAANFEARQLHAAGAESGTGFCSSRARRAGQRMSAPWEGCRGGAGRQQGWP